MFADLAGREKLEFTYWFFGPAWALFWVTTTATNFAVSPVWSATTAKLILPGLDRALVENATVAILVIVTVGEAIKKSRKFSACAVRWPGIILARLKHMVPVPAFLKVFLQSLGIVAFALWLIALIVAGFAAWDFSRDLTEFVMLSIFPETVIPILMAVVIFKAIVFGLVAFGKTTAWLVESVGNDALSSGETVRRYIGICREIGDFLPKYVQTNIFDENIGVRLHDCYRSLVTTDYRAKRFFIAFLFFAVVFFVLIDTYRIIIKCRLNDERRWIRNMVENKLEWIRNMVENKPPKF
jgi:hypothetical protein